MLRAAGFQSDLRDDIMAWKRTKLLTNLAGGLQAACGTVPEDLLRLLQAEAEAVFLALDLPYHPVAELLALCPTTSVPLADGRTRPGGSTWQSVARGRPTEAEALAGEVVDLAGRAGIDTPLCRRMVDRCGALQRPAAWTVGGLRGALVEAPEGEELVFRRPSLDAVRRRPGMYFGDPDDAAAPIQLLLEVLGNSLDQHLGGRCTRIDVRLVADGFSVADDGPGVEPDRLHGYLSALHSGATADGHWPHVHPRLSFGGVGLAPVNALCRRFEWTTRFAGRATRRRYAFGQPLGPAEDLGPTTTTGLEVEAVIDRDILAGPVDLVLVVDALERLAALSDLAVTLDGHPVRADGLAGLVTRRAGCAGRRGFGPADVQLRRRHGDVSVDLAMFVGERDDRHMGWSFINFSETLGGTHVEGLLRAVEASRFRRHGLLYGLHVLLEGPRFRSPTRDWLDNGEAEVAVHAVVAEALARLAR